MNRDPDDCYICAAIPVSSKDAALSLAKRASKEGVDFIEFRLDYCSTILDWSVKDLEDLVTCVENPIILTLRDVNEGGQLPLEWNERAEFIRKMIDSSPTFVDLEASLSLIELIPLLEYGRERKVDFIFSYHDFTSCPSYSEAESLITKFLHKFENWLERSVLKLIFTAQSFEDNFVPLSLLDNYSGNVKLITFCMGELGIPSRVLSLKHGAFLSFASLGEKTAPGQVSLSMFRAYLQEDEESFLKRYAPSS